MVTTDMPALEVQELGYAYKKHRALNGVSFRVEVGSIHGFVGPNGAGKTTALKILATLLKPQAGKGRIFDLDIVRDYKKVRGMIGFMPDHFSMYRQMTVFECLDFFAAAYGMGLKERDRVINDILDLTDMSGRRHDLTKGLSRGMQQRVSLARVLVHDPKLLLLDEPASGLDPRARIELMEILRELRRMGKTVFISSHILSELAELCDSFTIIDRGKIKYSGPKTQLLSYGGETQSYIVTLAARHEPTEQALRALPGVTAVAPLEEEPSYRVTFAREATGPNAILQAALANAAQVVGFREDVRHLNEAFMDLTDPGVPA